MYTRLRRAALLPALAIQLAAAAIGGPWPDFASDLKPDPDVLWGQLPNGLRYAVRHDPEPKGRVSIRLLVAVGSMEERESERGIAHFIEHMAYRGTLEHPNGGMTDELQRLGIGFGPDSAAYTFWDHTIYQLELPDTTTATLREGLGVFREYAEDITFDPRLIDKEREVILNERDLRDTPMARMQDANLEMLWPQARQMHRKPIGLVDNIRRFTRGEFIDFYNAWYRPERMLVVAVGDIGPPEAARVIESVMRGLKARAPARGDEIRMVPESSAPPTVHVFVDPGLGGASCALEHPFPEAESPDTHERRVALMRRGMAFMILQRRAMKFAKSTDGRLVVPVANLLNPLPGWTVAEFGGSGTIQNWKSFMTDLEQEHRRTFQYGFTDEEVALAKANLTAYYDDAVRTSATWRSDWIADQIANSVMAGHVFTTPALARSDVAGELSATTAKDCLAEFRKAWGSKPLGVFVSTSPAFKVSSPEIAAALNDSRGKPVSRPVQTRLAGFGYTSFGAAGRISHEGEIADLGVRQAEFENGVRLNFKATDYEAGSVTVAVRVGTGRLTQPKSQPGLDLLANAIVTSGGVGKHSIEELQDVLAGHSISFSFSVDNDAAGFWGRCTPGDLGLCLRILTAYITDPAYRSEALEEARASTGNMYTSMAASPMGPITMQSMRVMAGGDLRFGTATPAEFNARTIGEVRSWLDPQFKDGPIELSIVGDTTWADARDGVASTLGALPSRKARSSVKSSEVLGCPQKPPKPEYLSATNPSIPQVAIAWCCPVPDLDGIHEERRCRLLAAVLTERMRLRLREELGAAYAFQADFVQCEGFEDLSYFVAYTMLAPEHARRADELIKAEIRSLERGRISKDEFLRSKEPFLKSREKDLRDNGYWAMTVLKDAQQRPQRIAAARDRQSDCEAITIDDLRAISKRYFAYEHWFQFVTFPMRAPTGPVKAFTPGPSLIKKY